MSITEIAVFFGFSLLLFAFAVFRMFKRLSGKLDEHGLDIKDVTAQVIHQAKQQNK